MEHLVKKWTETTKQIYQGVLIYTSANLLYSIFNSINNVVNGASNLVSFAERGTIDTSVGFLDIICWLFLAGLIYGYYLFLTGLGNFRPLLSTEDSNSINKIRIAVILGIIAAVFRFIPFLGLVGGILNLIGFIMMLIGYSALKSSTTFPNKAREGASKLFTAMILTIVAAVIGIIPLVGWIFALIINIIVFFMILSGWATIKNSRPHVQEREKIETTETIE